MSLADKYNKSRDEISQMFVRDQRYRIMCCLEMEMLSVIYVYIYAAINAEARTKKFSVRTFWVTVIRERNKRRSVYVIPI